MVLCVMDRILSRLERNADYPFLDTKLSLVTGKDFADDDLIRGRGVIYSWIQGRGLEALAGHDVWITRQPDLPDDLKRRFHERLGAAMATVACQMEAMREANDGRLYFMMDRQGRPLRVVDCTRVKPGEPVSHKGPRLPTSMSDMFYCKGLAAVAWRLGDGAMLAKAENLWRNVHRDVLEEKFGNDQQQFDPRNPVKGVPGRFGHASRMIGIGAAARFLECTGHPKHAAIGIDFIDFILRHHVHVSPNPAIGMQYDMWEFRGARGKPFSEDGVLRSDPGHATEFAGLALKLISLAESMGAVAPSDLAKVANFKRIGPEVLGRNFANGFTASGLGIVKGYDLVARKAINDQMPWWSLPETIRAAAMAMNMCEPRQRPEFLRIAAECSNAFFGHFVKPFQKTLGLMAAQTLAADGSVADVIPATPDADPGYHTGLSIIDAVEILERQSM